MKKTVLLLAFILLLSVSVVSALTPAGTTYIAGKIYDATQPSWPTVSNATVNVTCNGNNLTTTSVAEGAYSVTYNASLCTFGDSISVYAFKGGLSGWGDGNTVSVDMTPLDVSIGVSNVPLVPEFGLIIGGLTIISAVCVFFFVRKQ